jgi:lysophospholipase L1-like esterase
MPRRALVHLLFALWHRARRERVPPPRRWCWSSATASPRVTGLPRKGLDDPLQQRLAAEHHPHRVVNASISGDTTAGGRTASTLLARDHPSVTVIELGGNDGLRGGSLDAMRANLDDGLPRQ